MPTYDYRCYSCGIEFEEFQSMAAERLTVCPHCGGRVHRLISSGAGLIFKGSGFYETDYKRKTDSGAPSKKTKKPADSSDSTSKVETKTSIED